ncbi:hypothetical protein [Methanosarcina sp. UBA5]|nr:hypothetical protein [Methanosarcina sp. UBA5]
MKKNDLGRSSQKKIKISCKNQRYKPEHCSIYVNLKEILAERGIKEFKI